MDREAKVCAWPFPENLLRYRCESLAVSDPVLLGALEKG